MPQLFFRPKYVWFPIHLKGTMIPDPSGQLAELIVYITSTRIDLYSHQILLSQLHTLRLPEFFHFHGDFHQKWHFAHLKISFAHPELPFLVKSMHVTIFWCWPSLIEYSSCDNHGCDWSLVFHWQAQRGQAPPTQVMNDKPVWPCLVSLTSHLDTKFNGNGNTAHGWPFNLLIVFNI